MAGLVEKIVASTNVSLLLAITVLAVVLIGILVSELYENRVYREKGKFLLALLGGFVVHDIFDAFSIFYPTSLILKVDIFVDASMILLSIFMFYLLWEDLDRSLKYASVFFIVTGLIVDVLAEIYLEIILLELIHFILMLGIILSLYFLVIKFLIDTSGAEL